jgi:Sperm tail
VQILESKDGLIRDMCAHLRLQDDQFVRGLKQQAEDVDDCLSAMAQEVEVLHEAYTMELAEIERAFMKVWPAVILLDCFRHVLQSWERNCYCSRTDVEVLSKSSR